MTEIRFAVKAVVWGMFIAIFLCSKNAFVLSATMPEAEANIKIEQEWKGYYCGYSQSLKQGIYTQSQWKETWEKAHSLILPKPELPRIDFEKEMVIAVFMGEQNSGGYEIIIKEITMTDKEVIVKVEEKTPAAETLNTMALTQPYHIAVIAKSSFSVRFSEDKLVN